MSSCILQPYRKAWQISYNNCMIGSVKISSKIKRSESAARMQNIFAKTNIRIKDEYLIDICYIEDLTRVVISYKGEFNKLYME